MLAMRPHVGWLDHVRSIFLVVRPIKCHNFPLIDITIAMFKPLCPQVLHRKTQVKVRNLVSYYKSATRRGISVYNPHEYYSSIPPQASKYQRIHQVLYIIIINLAPTWHTLSRYLTQPWKMAHLQMVYLLKMGGFSMAMLNNQRVNVFNLVVNIFVLCHINGNSRILNWR